MRLQRSPLRRARRCLPASFFVGRSERRALEDDPGEPSDARFDPRAAERDGMPARRTRAGGPFEPSEQPKFFSPRFILISRQEREKRVGEEAGDERVGGHRRARLAGCHRERERERERGGEGNLVEDAGPRVK